MNLDSVKKKPQKKFFCFKIIFEKRFLVSPFSDHFFDEKSENRWIRSSIKKS